jgi:hypothetical protein
MGGVASSSTSLDIKPLTLIRAVYKDVLLSAKESYTTPKRPIEVREYSVRELPFLRRTPIGCLGSYRPPSGPVCIERYHKQVVFLFLVT